MTKSSNNINKSIGFIIGIPVLLLLGSLFLIEPAEEPILLAQANKYYANLPEQFRPLADTLINRRLSENYTLSEKDSFAAFLEESAFERRLIIMKLSPSTDELQNDFNLEITPKKSSQRTPLKMTLSNNALIYKYRNVEHAIFIAKLPFIDISSIKIVQKMRFPQEKPWIMTIESDLPEIQVNPPEFVDGALTRSVHPLRPLLDKYLNEYGISHDFIGYKKVNDTIKEVFRKDFENSDGQSLTMLSVSEPDSFWEALHDKSASIEELVDFSGEQIDAAKDLLIKYQSEAVDFQTAFDMEKWINYFGITKLFVNSCVSEPMLFYLNDATNKFEPYFSNHKCIGEDYGFVAGTPIDDRNFVEAYVEGLKKFSQIDFKAELSNSPDISALIKWINNGHPEKIFDLDYVGINQLKIKKFLQQSTIIKPELISINKEQLVFSVKNVSYFPVRITGLNHKGKKQVIDLNPQQEIESGERDTIVMDLPRSFENLFVSKKKKTTGFLLHKHIYDLKVSFRTLGGDNSQFASIIPYQEKEAVAEDLFRSPEEETNHPQLVINEERKALSFRKDSVIINAPLVLPAGYKFRPRPGTVIDIVEGGKIISYASFDMIGNKNKPIKVISSDGKGQGILVLGAQEQSLLRHVSFDGLTHPKHGDWSVTGAVTFYESPVRLSHVTVSNNRCEDALNIVRTKFTMIKCTISNTQSDAFDGDFVVGTISDSRFENLGNDAIDVSGSDLTIKNVVVSYAGDKGLSAGEDSKMTVSDVEISNSEIGVAGKDLSIVDIKRITIKDTKLGFTAFKKKPEFGPSSITVINHDLENLEMNYLIESSSSLIVDGEKIETTQNVKDRMYGVEFGVSSAETRNSQN